MARETIEVDGVEVQIPKVKRRLINTDDAPRMGRKKGLTGRQHFEHSLKTIWDKGVEYMTGDGDDIDRAFKMVSGDDNEE